LYADYQAPEGYFGAGSTPILEGGRLLVNVGGREGAGLVALDPATGETVWAATDEGASYSSPTVATIDGRRRVIFVTRLSVLSLDAATGEVGFRFRFGSPGPTVNAATPLVLDGGRLFVSASYGVGAVCAQIQLDGAETLWESDDAMSSQYMTSIAHDGLLYGVHGREDAGRTYLRCVDPLTGEVRWSEPDFGMATMLLADGKLVLQKTDGQLVLARPSPEGYQELARATISDSTTRALPALAGGRLYVRDTRRLMCVEIGGR
jgi:outer membrane protein assembly factor BamB